MLAEVVTDYHGGTLELGKDIIYAEKNIFTAMGCMI